MSWFFGEIKITSRCVKKNKINYWLQAGAFSFSADLGPADPVCNYRSCLITQPQISILQPYTYTYEVNVEKSEQRFWWCKSGWWKHHARSDIPNDSQYYPWCWNDLPVCLIRLIQIIMSWNSEGPNRNWKSNKYFKSFKMSYWESFQFLLCSFVLAGPTRVREWGEEFTLATLTYRHSNHGCMRVWQHKAPPHPVQTQSFSQQDQTQWKSKIN